MDNISTPFDLNCIYCSSKKIYVIQLRNNKYSVKSIYKCLSCKKRFTPEDGYKKFRHSPVIIKTALELLKERTTLSQIVHYLNQTFEIKVTRKTILDWKRRFIS